MKKILFFVFPVIILSVLHPRFCDAQKEAWKWYFGYHAAMDFSTGAPVALYNSSMSEWEGCSSIADANGDLLFYTDGISAWNTNHTQMPNGYGMLGNSTSTQSALIVPKPGSSSIYYIFVTSGYDAHYSEVDMTLQGGLGDVTATKNILLTNNSAEKLAGVLQSNGVDYWVCTHQNGTDIFQAFSVTSAGVNGTPVNSNGGNVMGGNIGQLQFSPNGKMAAMATYSDPTFTPIQVFDFNDSSGVFTFDFGLPFTNVNQTYGVEFSPSQNFLYSTGGDPSYYSVHQWNLAAGSLADIIASDFVIGTTVGYAGSLQLGPDNKIYVAQENYSYVGVINNPDSSGAACDFDGLGVNLSPETMGLGLPNFLASFFSSINVDDLCFGDSTHFSVSGTGNDSLVNWDFGDTASGAANQAAGVSVKHVFTAPDTFTVTVIHYLNGGTIDSSYKTIIIHPFPSVVLGNDTSICEGDTLLLDAGNAGASYSWSDGSSTQTILAISPGTYAVLVSNGFCESIDSIIITNHPCPDQQTILSASDTIVCQKFCLSFFDQSINNPTAWQWFFEGGIPSSSIAQNPSNICYNSPGTYDVMLITTGALGNDTLLLPDYITVNPTPAFPVITQNGYVLTSSPSTTYQWQLNSINIPGATNQSYTVLQSGLYSIIVGDSNGCQNSSSIKVFLSGIDDVSNDTNIFIYPNPSSGSFTVELSIGLMIGEVSIDVVNTLGQIVFSSREKISSSPFKKEIQLGDVARGVYFIAIKTENELVSKKILISE